MLVFTRLLHSLFVVNTAKHIKTTESFCFDKSVEISLIMS